MNYVSTQIFFVVPLSHIYYRTKEQAKKCLLIKIILNTNYYLLERNLKKKIKIPQIEIQMKESIKILIRFHVRVPPTTYLPSSPQNYLQTPKLFTSKQLQQITTTSKISHNQRFSRNQQRF